MAVLSTLISLAANEVWVCDTHLAVGGWFLTRRPSTQSGPVGSRWGRCVQDVTQGEDAGREARGGGGDVGRGARWLGAAGKQNSNNGKAITLSDAARFNDNKEVINSRLARTAREMGLKTNVLVLR